MRFIVALRISTITTHKSISSVFHRSRRRRRSPRSHHQHHLTTSTWDRQQPQQQASYRLLTSCWRLFTAQDSASDELRFIQRSDLRTWIECCNITSMLRWMNCVNSWRVLSTFRKMKLAFGTWLRQDSFPVAENRCATLRTVLLARGGRTDRLACWRWRTVKQWCVAALRFQTLLKRLPQARCREFIGLHTEVSSFIRRRPIRRSDVDLSMLQASFGNKQIERNFRHSSPSRRQIFKLSIWTSYLLSRLSVPNGEGLGFW
jgi:hypothetical protein